MDVHTDTWSAQLGKHGSGARKAIRGAWEKTGLQTRLSLASGLLVFLTAGIIVFAAQWTLERTLLPSQSQFIANHARDEGRDLARAVDALALSARAMPQDAAVQGVMRAARSGGVDPQGGIPLRVWRGRLETEFAAMLEAWPQIDQLRLIGLADGGREIVRVERDRDDAVAIVPPAQLQRKGDREYYQRTIALGPGALHLSPIELNRERGAIQRPYKPVLRASTPVFDERGQLIGVFVVNIRMAEALRALTPALPDHGAIYVLNEAGQYLAHPNAARPFAFEFGQAESAWQDFPALADRLPDTPQSYLQDGQVIAVAPVNLAGQVRIAVIETAPLSAIFGRAPSIIWPIAFAVVLACAVGALGALWLARSVGAPIERMTRRARGEDASDPDAPGLPELRELGAALDDLRSEQGAESALREHAERNRLFLATVESTDDAVETLTLDGVVTSWNSGAERLYGYRADEIIGQNIEVVEPDDRRGETQTLLARVKSGERAPPVETVRVTHAGRRIDVSVAISPIRADDGAVIGAAKIVRDITYKKLNEQRFSAAFEASPSGMIVIERDGVISLANSEAARLFACERDQLIGASIEDLLPLGAREGHKALRALYLAEPTRRRMGAGRDLLARRRDGCEFPVEIGLTPMRTQRGDAVLAVVVDITDRKRAEEALATRTAELERSNEELQQFAYVASHDLQEPLRMVASYTQLIADKYSGRLDEKADKYIFYVVDGARRMQKLVKDLLAFSRVTSGMKPLAEVDPASVVNDAVRALGAVILETHAEIRVGDLPRVSADPTQLMQVFQNLIANAIKFRAERPPVVTIEARPGEGDEIVFSVADNGIGVEERHFERVFQMFQRLHARDQYEGSGIGLAIVKKVIERHNGRIWIDSVFGEGTTIYFTLRRA